MKRKNMDFLKKRLSTLIEKNCPCECSSLHSLRVSLGMECVRCKLQDGVVRLGELQTQVQ